MRKLDNPHPVDLVLVLITAIMLLIGTVMVFSSSVIMAEIRYQSPYVFIIKHIIWVILGLSAAWFFSQFDYRELQKLARPILIAAAVLLIAVIIFGTTKGGAKRWLQMGPISFQPSELSKLALIIAIADYLDRKKSRLKHFKGLLPVLGMIGLLSALIALEPDLGTPVIMTSVGLMLLFVGGARVHHLLLLGAGILPLVAVEIIRKPYRLERVKAFAASWGDISSTSYQLNQSILALGSGGFFGKGLAQSQMKLFYLPEAHTDFIFPIVGEELGFLGAIILIGLFIAFGWRGWQIAKNSTDYFGGLLAMGITLLIIFQALFNTAVTCGLLPTKGLPLPFVSFGGTALLINMCAVGILLNISRRKYMKV